MTLFIALPGSDALAGELAQLTGKEVAQIEVRRFPDGEAYVRVLSDVDGRDVFLLASLARADDLFLPLLFAVRTLRGLGLCRRGDGATGQARLRWGAEEKDDDRHPPRPA